MSLCKIISKELFQIKQFLPYIPYNDYIQQQSLTPEEVCFSKMLSQVPREESDACVMLYTASFLTSEHWGKLHWKM